MAVLDFSVDTVVYPGFKSHWGIEDKVYTRQTRDFDVSGETDDVDGTAWGPAGWENMLPGLAKGSAKINGLHSGQKGLPGDVLPQLQIRTVPFRGWVAHETLNALAPVIFFPCSVKKYSTTAKHKDAVEFETELGFRGDLNRGTILVSPKGNTQMATTGNGSTDDNTTNGGATPFGGVVQAHFYDVSGGTTPTVAPLVEHSVDGTVWTTLATLTTVDPTIPTTMVQRVRIPTTTTVNGRVRAKWTASGTPTSVQGIMMYSRGTDPDS